MLFKCLERDFGVAGADKVEQLLAVLADERFLVAASDVVPLDAIVVEVVQDGQARLTLLLKTWQGFILRILEEKKKKNEIRSIGSWNAYVIFAVVGLWATISTGVGPISQSALISGWDFSFRTGPEPSVDDGWLQISAIASVKVHRALDAISYIWRKQSSILY